MFSYIFMKVLENRPERYDCGINILSAGHAKKVRKDIVQTYVRPNIRMLDIGCGTGELIADAARAGATAIGIDISEGMLSVAQKRIDKNDLSSKIKLHQAFVAELDSLFDENGFDLITSTLVFSELYSEERRWALNQIRRILKPSGVFVLADEVKPRNSLKRLVHFIVRLPLAFFTYVVAQTGTKALSNISEEISKAGFEILSEEQSFLGGFIIISAKKSRDPIPKTIKLPEGKRARDDFSLFKSVWDYIGRWFPNPVEPGLREIGKPNRNSSVIVTSNFHLTVCRVEKSLKNEDCYLLVVPTNGINVWCGACGGDLNTHSVITAVKTSRIDERIEHRQLILPQFSAPGVDRRLLKQRTGWDAVFGPAYAKDIPSFLKTGLKKTPDQCIAKFSPHFRLEMLISMNFLIWVLAGIVTLVINPSWLFWVSALFWLPGIILYVGFPILPGQSGWIKACILSMLEIVGVLLFTTLVLGDPWWAHWGWIVAICTITMWLGFDLKGIVGGNPSEAEWLLNRLGIRSIGRFFSADVKKLGAVRQDRNKCSGCQNCLNVCPKGVFVLSGDKNEVTLKNQSECFTCNACVMQCPTGALSIE